MRYCIAGNGLVVVGTDTHTGAGAGAEIALRPTYEEDIRQRQRSLGMGKLLGWTSKSEFDPMMKRGTNDGNNHSIAIRSRGLRGASN
jgi:hypothetical protein